MDKTLRIRLICIPLCAALLFCACAPRNKREANPPPEPEIYAPESADDEIVEPKETGTPDFETVTAGIELTPPPRLSVSRPSADVVTASGTYYITGTSNPDAELFINGEAVKERGVFGSFGYFTELSEGENEFVFEQEDESQRVTITRLNDGEVYTTDRITKPSPEADDAVRVGEVYTLRCTAPSGALVFARIQDQTIELNQRVATAVDLVPAIFSAEYTPQGSGGNIDMGQVTYILELNGVKSEYVSEGRLLVIEDDAPLKARAVGVSATVFTEESVESEYFATLKRGAVDIVSDIGGDMYKLEMGGWVTKASLELLTEDAKTENIVSETVFTVYDRTETLRLKSTAAVPCKADINSGGRSFTFFRTEGVEAAELTGSRLFSGMTTRREEDDTVITLELSGETPLWGYLVEYEEDSILLTFRYAPKLQPGAQPLRGVTVALDPGHGGSDIGTAGISSVDGAVEKDINLATAKAVRNYLKALGADVLMTREGDDYSDLNERLEIFGQLQVDFAVSLHCNSIPYNSDGTGPAGVEIYYYEDASAALAEAVLQSLCQRTGRKNRGVRQANYRITLNSVAPTIMIETGFMTNPREYDSLCDPRDIYETAAAIADGIMASFI